MSRQKSPSTTTARKRAPRKSVARPKAMDAPAVTQFVGLEQRSALIAEAAFFRAEKRGFALGSEVEDWLTAESEVNAKLLHAARSRPRG